VVIIVVSLAKSDKGGEDVVSRGMSVVKRLVTEPVGKGVDAEGCVVDNDETADTCVIEPTSPIIPEQTGNSSGDEEAHDDDNNAVVLVLYTDKNVRVEIGDIRTPNPLGILLEEHPSEMSIHQTLSDRVGVLFRIGVSVVSTVVSGPPPDGSLNGTATKGSEDILKRSRCGV